jgi:hypothetical protein
MQWTLLAGSPVEQVLKNFPTFYEIGGYYRVHKRPPLVPILSQINSVHTTHPISVRTISIFTPIYFVVFLVVISFWLSHQYPISMLLLPIRATCTAHLILLDIIILIILGE